MKNMNLDNKKSINKTESKEEDEPVEDSQFSFLFSLSGGFYWTLDFFQQNPIIFFNILPQYLFLSTFLRISVYSLSLNFSVLPLFENRSSSLYFCLSIPSSPSIILITHSIMIFIKNQLFHLSVLTPFGLTGYISGRISKRTIIIK